MTRPTPSRLAAVILALVTPAALAHAQAPAPSSAPLAGSLAPSPSPAAITPAPPPPGHYLINIGHWQATTTFMGMTVASEHWCLQPKDIHHFLGGLSNHIYRCTYPINSTEGGRIHFKGSCTQTKRGKVLQQFNLEGTGSYTPTTVHMKADACCIKMMGIPVGGSANLEAHFISDACPPEAKPFKE